MKRVRIVAIAAVALGAAVTAGTKFQQAQEADAAARQLAALQSAPAPAAAPQAEPALTSVAALETAAPETPAALAPVPQQVPAPALSQSVSLVPAAPQDSAPAPVPAPRLATASIMPSVGAAMPSEPEPQQLAQADLTQIPATPVPAPVPVESAVAEEGASSPQTELNACAAWLVVTPAPGAMLDTTLYAPCEANQPVTVTHAGLAFDLRLGNSGDMIVRIPALTEDAEVTVTFADGHSETDATRVGDLAMMERVALQYQAPAALVLHAYEFGAGYDDEGHVYPGNPQRAGLAGHGFLTELGDATLEGAHLAQIYSYPRGETPRTGEVSLEIEVPVTAGTCGQTLEANAMELHGTAAGQVRQIRLDMPACDGDGGYLMLPGVLPELQIALAD